METNIPPPPPPISIPIKQNKIESPNKKEEIKSPIISHVEFCWITNPQLWQRFETFCNSEKLSSPQDIQVL